MPHKSGWLDSTPFQRADDVVVVQARYRVIPFIYFAYTPHICSCLLLDGVRAEVRGLSVTLVVIEREVRVDDDGHYSFLKQHSVECLAR